MSIIGGVYCRNVWCDTPNVFYCLLLFLPLLRTRQCWKSNTQRCSICVPVTLINQSHILYLTTMPALRSHLQLLVIKLSTCWAFQLTILLIYSTVFHIYIFFIEQELRKTLCYADLSPSEFDAAWAPRIANKSHRATIWVMIPCIAIIYLHK